MMDKVKRSISEVYKNGDNFSWWKQRFSSRITGPTLERIHGNHGTDFMSKDWDNLLILDACRADMFEEAVDLSQFDTYSRTHSIGCASPEWMENTFSDRTFPDTVYISANPWVSKIAPNSFHSVENLWLDRLDESEEDLQNVGWDWSLSSADHSGVPTIYADTLNRAVLDAFKKFPDKRYIVHYFQPHAPVVGNPDGSRKEVVRDEIHPEGALRTGGADRQEVWDAYTDNLLYVFTHAWQLATELGGRSVFTSDHGELFGEWMWPFPYREYAHPPGLRHPKLTEVPWAVKETGPRRQIVADSIEKHEADIDQVNSHLEDLGYL